MSVGSSPTARTIINHMKKKYRNITVDGVVYAWKADYDKWADFNVCSVRIWKDKKVIIYKDIPNEFSTITPKVISDIIKNHET